MLYALISPTGEVCEQTVAVDAYAAWDKAWEYLTDHGCGNLLARHYDGIEYEEGTNVPRQKSRYFYRRFYGKRKAAMDYARKHGLLIGPVRLVKA